MLKNNNNSCFPRKLGALSQIPPERPQGLSEKGAGGGRQVRCEVSLGPSQAALYCPQVLRLILLFSLKLSEALILLGVVGNEDNSSLMDE